MVMPPVCFFDLPPSWVTLKGYHAENVKLFSVFRKHHQSHAAQRIDLF